MRTKSEELSCREAGRRGGLARARKYSKAQLSVWGKLGGSERKVIDVQPLLDDRRRGLTFAEIGRRHGIHAATVARIIDRHQAASLARPPKKPARLEKVNVHAS